MQYPLEPSIESLLLELKKRARSEMVTAQEAYEELVEELINEKIEKGELSEQEDYMGLQENLIARWPDVLEYIKKQETKRP